MIDTVTSFATTAVMMVLVYGANALTQRNDKARKVFVAVLLVCTAVFGSMILDALVLRYRGKPLRFQCEEVVK